MLRESQEPMPGPRPPADPPRGLQPSPPGAPRRPGVLVVDDLGLVLVLLKAEMQQLGCNVWLAPDGPEALKLYEQHHEAIDLVLLDARRAGLGAPRILADLREIDPGVRCCFMTGYGGTRVRWYTRRELSRHRPERVFGKPFNPAAVARVVWGLLRPGESDAGGAAP